jgi:Fic family protein
MGRFEQRQWSPAYGAPSRRDRKAFSYKAYIPDLLASWEPRLPSQLVAELSDAEDAIRQLESATTPLLNLDGIARVLLRTESVASSKIEGIQANARRILEQQLLNSAQRHHRDNAIVEILGNITAMTRAIDVASSDETFTRDHLLDIHRCLLGGTRDDAYAGKIRDRQNWIGGTNYSPANAAFVPPPPELLDELIDDLVNYINSDNDAPLVQAAIAHAQFETIHPFIDGNGRTGRALIHVVLRRRNLARQLVTPISLILATFADDYVAALTSFRHEADANDADGRRSQSLQDILWLFGNATQRACQDASAYSARADELSRSWQQRLGTVRSDSALAALLPHLTSSPIVNLESAMQLTGRAKAPINLALQRLIKAGILQVRDIQRQRYRIYEAAEALDLFTDLERVLASPVGDTALEPPVRPTPARR